MYSFIVRPENLVQNCEWRFYDTAQRLYYCRTNLVLVMKKKIRRHIIPVIFEETMVICYLVTIDLKYLICPEVINWLCCCSTVHSSAAIPCVSLSLYHLFLCAGSASFSQVKSR